MAVPPFGKLLDRPAPPEITSDNNHQPGLGSEISAETWHEIEEIEANIRAAEQCSGSIIVG